mmetsp:Transcript_15235/g.35111  ORF Transcript_15235/g.35111 Transcript_15235/m.35111 type:complete len:813 (+) Transcript_15235:81-2519(+)
MKAWRVRIVFYGCVVAGLICMVSIYKRAIRDFYLQEKSYLINNEYQRSGHDNGETDGMHWKNDGSLTDNILRRSEPKLRPPIVVAPWTTVESKPPDSDNSSSGQNEIEKIELRSFVFAEPAKLDSEFGVPMTEVDKEENLKIKKEASRRLCARSKKSSENGQGALRCKENLDLLRCVSCSERDGTWYTAVSETGAVFGKAFNGTYLHFPNYNDGPFMYQQLDIAVPISGEDDKLRRFAAKLGPSIKKFRSGLFGARITIRFLITRFSFESPASGTKELEKFRLHLAKAAGLVDVADEVVFVPVEGVSQFSRAKAVNALHREAYHEDTSALAVIDVDLAIESKFLRNALTYPFPKASAYFPIMFSAYDPKSVKLVDKFIPNNSRYRFSNHHGHWRKFSFGMYVIAGSDAPHLSMDENFVGWGGEDNDFFSRVSKRLHIIRLHETGLTHVWHPKHCKLGGFVEKKYYQACIGSMAHFEGSQLGMYLKNLKENDRVSFDQIMASAEGKNDDNKNANAESMIKETDEIYDENPTVFVGVISSRENFGSRVKSIVETWGNPQNIPEGTLLRFFVGIPPDDSEFYGKSRDEDIEHLAEIAGIKDLSMVVVMDGVVDNEYPPVRKNTAMIEKMNEIVEAFENDVDAPSTFQWIYKVDDDAYVNFSGMLSFIRTRSPEGYHVYGERGTGRKEDSEGLKKGGLVKPYCTGGPGYIMSREMVKATAPRFNECVREFDNSDYREYLWHSDSVIGICIFKVTGAGCWDDKDYYTHRFFRHNLNKEDPFIETDHLGETIATHPFKEYSSMAKQHSRYIELASTLM